MDLSRRYTNYPEAELIRIIDSKDDEFTPKAREVAQQELRSRLITPSATTAIACRIWDERIRSDIKKYLTKEYIMESQFLSEEELVDLLKKAFEDLKERKQLFKIDTTKYWPAALG